MPFPNEVEEGGHLSVPGPQVRRANMSIFRQCKPWSEGEALKDQRVKGKAGLQVREVYFRERVGFRRWFTADFLTGGNARPRVMLQGTLAGVSIKGIVVIKAGADEQICQCHVSGPLQ